MRGLKKLKPRSERYTYADPELPGHYIRVQPSGAKSFVVVARDPRGKQYWRTVGAPPMAIDDARDIGRKTIRAIREAAPESFEGVAQEWFKRHVTKRGLRSAAEIERFMKQHLFGVWAGRDFASIKRRDVSDLLTTLRMSTEQGRRTMRSPPCGRFVIGRRPAMTTTTAPSLRECGEPIQRRRSASAFFPMTRFVRCGLRLARPLTATLFGLHCSPHSADKKLRPWIGLISMAMFGRSRRRSARREIRASWFCRSLH